MVTFKASLAQAKENIEYRNQCLNGNCGFAATETVAGIASMALGVIFSSMAASKSYNTTITNTNTDDTTTTNVENDAEVSTSNNDAVETTENNTENNEHELTMDEKKAAVKELLKEVFPKIEESEHFEELVNKYVLYKEVHKDWDDKKITDRLIMYYKALLSHDKQKLYGECLERVTKEYLRYKPADYVLTPKDEQCIKARCIRELKAKGIEDVDAIITAEISAKRTNGGNETASYFLSQFARGEGYIELYDTNGDQKISQEEFIALEKKDNGGSLDEAELGATISTFNQIDINNDGSIDKNEMGAYLYAMSTINDKKDEQHPEQSEDTSDAISFDEYYDATTSKSELTFANARKFLTKILNG